MKILKPYLATIETELSKLKADLETQLKVPQLYEPIQYILSMGGKRLRPALVLMAANIYSKDTSQALLPALGVEIYHNFTLLHDDIMDKAPIRRGKPTVHTKWNENIAILAGDTMMVKANDCFLQLPPQQMQQVFAEFNKAALEVCIGQQHDMNFETRHKVTMPEYVEMITLKTSVLIAMSLKIGAIIGGAPTADIEALYKFGLNLGLSFQVQDDILDLYAQQEVFGKTTGGDIIANKKTFLLITAIEQAQGQLAEQLDNWLQKTQFDNTEKITAVRNIYDKLNIKAQAQAQGEAYYQKAIAALDGASDPLGKLSQLHDFAAWLMKRQK